jgi:hypothetical protein
MLPDILQTTPIAAAAPIPSQTILCGICCGQIGDGTGSVLLQLRSGSNTGPVCSHRSSWCCINGDGKWKYSIIVNLRSQTFMGAD